MKYSFFFLILAFPLIFTGGVLNRSTEFIWFSQLLTSVNSIEWLQAFAARAGNYHSFLPLPFTSHITRCVLHNVLHNTIERMSLKHWTFQSKHWILKFKCHWAFNILNSHNIETQTMQIPQWWTVSIDPFLPNDFAERCKCIQCAKDIEPTK